MKRVAAVTLWTICCSLFVIGVAANLPWLIAENSRLEPWKVPIIWLSEITGFVLFVEYGIRHIIGRHPDGVEHGLTVKAFVVATVFDCALSAFSIVEEDAAHSRAVQSQATVVTGHARLQNTGHMRYTFSCAFRDQRGVQHTGWFSSVNDGVPDNVRRAIAQRQLPVNVTIAYDPKWPARSWLADVPYTHDNRLFICSLLMILFSVGLAAALAVFRQSASWLPSPRVAPFLGTTWIFCMGALIQGGW